jgi:exodeoxyribonuclease VII large subunit
MITSFIDTRTEANVQQSFFTASYSVSEITHHIKERLEADPALQDIWIEGEVSNWVRSRAGHCYFTLKDARASIRAVMWRSTAGKLLTTPQDGQAVRAHGYVSVYEPQGQYQFYVDTLYATGHGELYLEFEALKARLEAEGLFDAERKRALPAFPACIGVVTSPTAAALRDILNVLDRRWPLVRVLISPTLVQGTSAPPQIVAALQALYGRRDVDLIIVARGGGSMEDLWAFNDERVARAIVESPVPVISGVGHEIDFTIADFCADLRAPTPSAAAEVAVPDGAEVSGQFAALEEALLGAICGRLDEARSALETRQQALARLSPQGRIDRGRQGVDDLSRRAERAWAHRRVLLREQVAGLEHRLEGLNPYATLDRGYAVVRRRDGSVLRTIAQAVAGEPIDVRVSDGSFPARVEGHARGEGQ